MSEDPGRVRSTARDALSAEGEEAARAQRVEALRRLARTRLGEPDPAAASGADGPARAQCEARAGGRRSSWRRRWPAVTGVVLVVAVAAGAIVIPRLRTTAPTSARLTLDLAAAHAFCPGAPFWSPDGAQIAITATASDCHGAGGAGDSILLLYDAHTGKLRQSIAYGSTMRALHLGATSGATSWSPDGTLLAFPVGKPSNTDPYGYSWGALLMPTRGGQPRVLLDPTPVVSGPQAATKAVPSAGEIWDVRSGSLAHRLTPPLAHRLTPPLAHRLTPPLAPVLAYTWAADGGIAPAPDGALPARVAPGTIAGGPAAQTGRDTFSVWQAGTLRTIVPRSAASAGGGATVAVPTEVYMTNLVQWSPDGRYLLTHAQMAFRLAQEAGATAPAEAACDSADKALCEAPLAPLPDAATAAVAGRLREEALAAATSGQRLPTNDTPLVWRPDGRALAVILPGDGPTRGNTTIRISVYRADGRVPVGMLSLPRVIAGDAGDQIFAWSPDGQRMAGMDPAGRSVTIWGAGALPR